MGVAMTQLYGAILRTVLREARVKGWRPLNPFHRTGGRWSWVSPDKRIVVRIEPSPTVGYGTMQMTVSQNMEHGWVDIDVAQIGAWPCALDILAARHIIDPKHAAAWRHGQGDAINTIPRGTGAPAESFLAGLGVAADARPAEVLAGEQKHLRAHVYTPYAADLPVRA